MRVVYVHPFAQQLSGPDESLLALLEPLVSSGLEGHLVVPRFGPLSARYLALGVRVHVHPLTILHRGMTPAEIALFGPRLAARTARLASLMRVIRPDVVHTNMEVVLEGGLAARMLGIPHVMHYRGNSLDSPKRIFDVLTLLWTTLADHVFCISKATANIFHSRGYDGKKVEVLYNPIKVAAFESARRSSEVRASLGASGTQPLIVTMGRIHPRKDIETFVRSCARVAQVMPEACFAIVGSADSSAERDYLSRLTELVAEKHLRHRVVFAGARTDVPEVMKAADVFVLTSRHEGFGRVLAEAMAAGTPVVATREGALPELIDEPRFGLGATAESDTEFSEQILALLSDPARRGEIGAAAAVRAQGFDARTVAGRVWRCYQEVTRGRQVSRRKADPTLAL